MWSYDDISIFVAVVEHGGFTAAARHLGMPSSTVSRRINTLESELNIKLLERSSRKMRLTEKGQTFFEQCAPHVHGLKESTRELSASLDEIKGKLKITAPTYLGSEFLGDWFVEFADKYAAVGLEIRLSNQYEDILEEDIDVAIRIGPLEDSRFVAQQLFTSHNVLCASTRYLDEAHAIDKPQDIKQHRFVILGNQGRDWAFKHKDSDEVVRVRAPTRVRVNDIPLARRAVHRGLGLACLPQLAVDTLLASGQIRPLLSDYEVLPRRDVFLLYPSRKFLSKRTRLFLDFMKDKAAGLAARYSQP